MAEDSKARPAVLGEVDVVTAPVEGSHGGRHMVSNSGTQAEVDSALTYSVQTEGTLAPDTTPVAPAVAPAPDAAPVTSDVVAPDSKPEDSRSVQGRINTLTYRAREADRRVERAEQRTAELELQLATQPPPVAPAASAVEPIPAEFTTTAELGDYLDRTIRAGVQAGLAERDTQTREAQAVAAATTVEHTWETQLTSAAADHEDWSVVFAHAGETEHGTDAVIETAKTFANGAQVLYDLAKSPQALTQLGQMTPRDRERAFAVASAHVAQGPPASEPVVPAVPPTPSVQPTPMPPVAPSAPTVASPVLTENFTRGDYKAWKVANGIKF